MQECVRTNRCTYPTESRKWFLFCRPIFCYAVIRKASLPIPGCSALLPSSKPTSLVTFFLLLFWKRSGLPACGLRACEAHITHVGWLCVSLVCLMETLFSPKKYLIIAENGQTSGPNTYHQILYRKWNGMAACTDNTGRTNLSNMLTNWPISQKCANHALLVSHFGWGRNKGAPLLQCKQRHGLLPHTPVHAKYTFWLRFLIASRTTHDSSTYTLNFISSSYTRTVYAQQIHIYLDKSKPH